jgi:hypothetical protein
MKTNRQISQWRRRAVWTVGALALLMFATGPRVAEASLLTPAYESRLEGWLGQGDLDFTNIYAKDGVGDSASEFHAAADGQGATFTLLEAIYLGQTYVIGGYNPHSWNSSNNFSYTYDDADRTAFIYNLTTDVVQRQRLNSDPYDSGFGQYQTFNGSLYGPVFGDYDLAVNRTLNGDLALGRAIQYSFGNGEPCAYGGQSILGTSYLTTPCTVTSNGYDFTVGALEVYTFAPAATLPDAGSTLTLFGIAALGLTACRRYVARS